MPWPLPPHASQRGMDDVLWRNLRLSITANDLFADGSNMVDGRVERFCCNHLNLFAYHFQVFPKMVVSRPALYVVTVGDFVIRPIPDRPRSSWPQ